MRRDSEMTIESFEENLILQAGKAVLPARVDELYNLGCCLSDSVDIVMNEYISPERVAKLNQVLLYSLNTSISKFGVKNDVSAYYFTQNFLDKEQKLVLLRLNTIKEGMNNIKGVDKKVVSRLNETIKIAEGLKTIEDLKIITNE